MDGDLAEIRSLFADADVQRVFRGDGIGVQLTDTISLLSGLRTSDASAAGIA